MKIQYASDLHLEFSDNWRYLRDNPIDPLGDVLVLAGDIGYLGDDNYRVHPFWDYVSDNFKQVLVVPGNHEFYKGYDIGNLTDGFCESIRHNVKWYYNSVVQIEDVEFILTTLWSHIEPHRAYWIEQCVSDFRRIVKSGEVITSTEFNNLHQGCVEFLTNALNNKGDMGVKRVVASHHLPSFICVSPKYKESPLNGAFASEYYDLIASSNIECWIYGHSHCNLAPIEIEGTTLLSNQLGYVHHNEHRTFDRRSIIAVSSK